MPARESTGGHRRGRHVALFPGHPADGPSNGSHSRPIRTHPSRSGKTAQRSSPHATRTVAHSEIAKTQSCGIRSKSRAVRWNRGEMTVGQGDRRLRAECRTRPVRCPASNSGGLQARMAKAKQHRTRMPRTLARDPTESRATSRKGGDVFGATGRVRLETISAESRHGDEADGCESEQVLSVSSESGNFPIRTKPPTHKQMAYSFPNCLGRRLPLLILSK